MRLKLVGGAQLIETESGARVLTSRGSISFTGPSIHRWLQRLAPFLDGQRTLVDLTSGLPPERADVVRKIVSTLIERRAVREIREPPRIVAVIGRGPLHAAVLRACRLAGISVVESLTAEADGVLHLPRTVDEAESVARDGVARGVLLSQAMIGAREAWLGAGGWRRLGGFEASAEIAGRAAVLVANQLVQSFSSGPPVGKMIRVDLRTGESDEHPFVPHPSSLPVDAETESDFVLRIAALAASAPLDPSELSRRAVVLRDARLGVLGEIDEGDLAQLPLRVAKTTVADPMGLAGRRVAIAGAGVDFASARYATALRALAVYSSLAVDPRRFVSGFARAWNLKSGGAVLVPAESAFPALRGRVEPCGLAAGLDWAGAIEAGLLQHCERRTAVEITASGRRFPRVDPSEYATSTLRAIGGVEVYDVTGSSKVPAIACMMHGRPVAYGCGLSRSDALRAGLTRLMLDYQARANGEDDYAPTAPPPPPLVAEGRAAPAGERLTVAELATRLGGARVIPLDHDRQVHRIMPYAVQVLIDG